MVHNLVILTQPETIMNLLNISVPEVRDNRIGKYARYVRGVDTPFGTFRSVAVAADHAMAHAPQYWADCVGIPGITIDKIRKRVYARIYQRCLKNSYGWRFTTPDMYALSMYFNSQ
jgi:hypothetical protein